MTHTTPSSSREAERLDWARAALGDPRAPLERASMDAGFRSYWRSSGSGGSRIVMDSPPGLEDVRPWLRIRDLLEGGGVRVPRVLARDIDRGFLLLEDLGTQTLLQVLDDDNADAQFDGAIGQLLRLQAIAPPSGLPAYDEALLARELRLFDAWFLGTHLGIALDCGAMEVLDGAYRRLVDAALAQPRVLVHRDFMPRNLMPADDGPAVLDFQDAVQGPIAYDVLSLSWPAADRVRRDFDWIGIQRHLKVVGIFARLCHRDGKPKYLADVPRFFAYLDEVLPRYREFDDLRRLLDGTVKPAIAARAQAGA